MSGFQNCIENCLDLGKYVQQLENEVWKEKEENALLRMKLDDACLSLSKRDQEINILSGYQTENDQIKKDNEILKKKLYDMQILIAEKQKILIRKDKQINYISVKYHQLEIENNLLRKQSKEVKFINNENVPLGQQFGRFKLKMLDVEECKRCHKCLTQEKAENSVCYYHPGKPLSVSVLKKGAQTRSMEGSSKAMYFWPCCGKKRSTVPKGCKISACHQTLHAPYY